MKYKFKKKNRIKTKKEFAEIFNEGKIVKGLFYFCKYKRNKDNISRIGISIKRSIGNAVIRNYEKRIVKEFFRLNRHQLLNGYDLLFIIKNKNGTFSEKENEFVNIIRTINNNG